MGPHCTAQRPASRTTLLRWGDPGLSPGTPPSLPPPSFTLPHLSPSPVFISPHRMSRTPSPLPVTSWQGLARVGTTLAVEASPG